MTLQNCINSVESVTSWTNMYSCPKSKCLEQILWPHELICHHPPVVMSKQQRKNVPQTFRQEGNQNVWVFITESAPSKEIMSIWSRRTDSGPNRNTLFSTRQIRERYQNVLVSFPKLYRNVCPFVFDIQCRCCNSPG
jgi:hypothetical protein